MKTIKHGSVYGYELGELEWYGVSDDMREAMQQQCMAAAKDNGAQYVTIVVKPDALMSISPVQRRHQVWRHTFDLPAEELFKRNLNRVLYDCVLPHARKKAILRLFAESYDG